MSNKFLQISDFYKRLYLSTKIKKNYLVKSFKNDSYLPKSISHTLKKYNATTYIKNRCILTGRSRAVSRHFKINRMPLKNLILHGFISGVSKYSW